MAPCPSSHNTGINAIPHTSCQGTVLMTTDTFDNVIECQCSMTARGLMYILPVKLFYIYILNMIARPIKWPKFMIVGHASSVPACCIHARDNEPYIVKNEGSISLQGNHWSTYLTVNIVCYKLQECHNEHLDCHNLVEQLDQNLHTKWRKEPVIPNLYSAFRDKLTRMLKQFGIIWDGQREIVGRWCMWDWILYQIQEVKFVF